MWAGTRPAPATAIDDLGARQPRPITCGAIEPEGGLVYFGGTMIWVITFLIIAVLIAANALYVVAEFSSVSARPARLSGEAEQGNRLAAQLLETIEDSRKLDTYIATCQVGITISSLALGFYGQAQLAVVVAPLLERVGIASGLAAQSLSATVVLALLSIFQILLGELVPKNIAIQYPERLAMLTARPMQWSIAAFKPLIWLFNGSGQVIMRALGLINASEHTHVHAPEEIAMLVDESRTGGVLPLDEYRLLRNTLNLARAKIQQVMIPKESMLTAPSTISGNELLEILAESQFSRAPIYRNSIDTIVGAVHIKELLCADKRDIEDVIRPVLYVHESMDATTVFTALQRKHFQIAIVVDEFGATVGMVTVEDLVEEIFGEIEDEFDLEKPPKTNRKGET